MKQEKINPEILERMKQLGLKATEKTTLNAARKMLVRLLLKDVPDANGDDYEMKDLLHFAEALYGEDFPQIENEDGTIDNSRPSVAMLKMARNYDYNDYSGKDCFKNE